VSHRNRSPIRRQEPLPRVPKVPPKRPYDYTLEENAAKVQEKSKNFLENLKRKKTEQSAEQPPLDPKVLKMLKNLHQPEPRLASDYDRTILKSDAAKRPKGKSVPQLGEQMNSCPPLQVFPNVQYDPEIIALYKEEAEAVGMSVAQYLSRCDFPTAEVVAYKYRYGSPLVRPEEIPNLPTRMRKLHKWYLEASQRGQNWIVIGINDEHYFRGTDDINIEFAELFQLYNHDALDKSMISAYCL